MNVDMQEKCCQMGIRKILHKFPHTCMTSNMPVATNMSTCNLFASMPTCNLFMAVGNLLMSKCRINILTCKKISCMTKKKNGMSTCLHKYVPIVHKHKLQVGINNLHVDKDKSQVNIFLLHVNKFILHADKDKLHLTCWKSYEGEIWIIFGVF
jgi:hypothetical protein